MERQKSDGIFSHGHGSEVSIRRSIGLTGDQREPRPLRVSRERTHARGWAPDPHPLTEVVEVTVRAAEAESFLAYYERDRLRLVGLAYMLTGSHWVAEDLVQDALAEAYRRWDTVRDYPSVEAWVRTVLVNKSRSRFRKVRSETKALTKLGALPAGIEEPPEGTSEIWRTVRKLPRRQAQAIVLQYWEGYTVAQIAEILGVTSETAKTHLKRARSTLATQLANVDEDAR